MTFSIFFALLFAVNAFPHVTIDPKSALAGEYAKLVFRIPHGCDGSPTTKITVKIPEGVVSVKPQVHPGWKISVKKGTYSKPVALHSKEIKEGLIEVTWNGGPLPDDYMDEFGLSVKLPDDGRDKLFFPAIQKCRNGVNEWVETGPTDHGHHGKLPSPILLLEKKSTGK